MRILLCQFGNETNTFVKGKLTFDMLVPDGWVKAETVVPKFKGTSSYLGGAIAAIEEEGAEVFPINLLTNGGNFGAGPLMSAECADYAINTICEELKAVEGQYDGIFFAIHGGGACEQDADLESYTLRAVRKVVGPDMPIMSSLDIHSNITQEMIDLSDGLFLIKEVPHNDCKQAGYLAAKMLIRKIRGEIDPKMALVKLPMLISSSIGSTMSGPAKLVKDFVIKYKEEHNLLDVGFAHGFSSTDIPYSTASVLVVADGYEPIEEAKEVARFVWEHHKEFVAPSFTASQAIDMAYEMLKDGYVVINESSDNPGSGCPGDGTHLLKELLKRNKPKTIMGPLYDPEAAAFLHSHKVGDKVSFKLGGKIEEINGTPVDVVDAEILNLSNGKLISAAPINFGVEMNYGLSARIRIGNVEVIVVSLRFQTYDDRPFIMTGCDMSQYEIVCLKSMNHFRGYFAPRADGIVAADTPGLRPADLRLNTYKNVPRPVFPLDDDVEFNI